MVVVVNPSGSQMQHFKKKSNYFCCAYFSLHLALSAKLSGAGATRTFGGGVLYNWHDPSASEVLVVAIC